MIFLVCVLLYGRWKKTHLFEQAVMQHIVGRGQCWNTIYMKEAEFHCVGPLANLRALLESVG